MWSSNLDAQADLLRERYRTYQDQAAAWRKHRKAQAERPPRRMLLPLAGIAGRWMARLGGRLISNGVRLQSMADAQRRRQEQVREARAAGRMPELA
jgi:hypothetical protein